MSKATAELIATGVPVAVEYQSGLWEKKTWVWTRYDATSERAILRALRAGESAMGLRFGAAHGYELDLVAMKQRNLLSNKVRGMRLVPLVADETQQHAVTDVIP